MGIRKPNDASELQMGTRKTDACADVIPKHVPDGGTFWHFNRSVLKSQVRTFLCPETVVSTNFEAHQIHSLTSPVADQLVGAGCQSSLARRESRAASRLGGSGRRWMVKQAQLLTQYIMVSTRSNGLFAVADSLWNTLHHDFTHEGYTAAAADYLWNSDRDYTHEVCNAAAAGSILNTHHEIIYFWRL